MPRLGVLSFLASCALFLSATVARSQSQAVPARITAPIDQSALVPLRGNVPSIARSEFDLGAAPAATPLAHVHLVLSRSAAQQAALDKYLAELSDHSSPNYHKWLTPAQYGRLYGPADADIAAIVNWLESHGLTVEPVAPGRTSIAFSGTVQQVEEALHVSIHSYDANGQKFLSNNADPQIPAALAPVIGGIAELNTIRPRAHHVAAGFGTYDSDLHRMKRAGITSSNGPRADLTTGSAGSYTLYLVPADAAAIYDTPNSTLNSNYTSGTSYNGSGVTIGLAGDAVIQAATVADYRTRFLGDSNQPTITNVDGVTDTTDTDEGYLDNEIASALAPGATIHFYTAKNLTTAIQQALTDNTVDILSVSFGECELFMGTGGNQLLNGYWQQAAGQGIAVTVSAGDSGSAGCDDQTSETTAVDGLAVSGFASTVYNVAVGGTDLGGLVSAFTTYVNTTSNSTNYGSAKGYIPESTWNDSTSTNTTISQDAPSVDTKGNTNINAGSGGESNCSINTSTSTTVGTCTSGYQRPPWQVAPGKFSADTNRDIPDVSLMSGSGGDNAAWLACTDDTAPNSSNVTVTANCTKQSDGQFYFAGFGGTSAAAPAFAGMLAMVQQKAGGRIGKEAVEELYDLYNGSNGSKIFHDITTGNISVPCTANSPNCTKNTAGNEFLSGYDTATGYDMATGLGSVDAAQLVSSWTTGPLVYMSASTPSAVSPGSQATSTITVGSDTGYTGTVTLTCSLTSSPSGASNLPSCSVSGTASVGSSQPATATATVSTTGTSARLLRPSTAPWPRVAGGAALALLLFWGIPARRRGWRALLSLLVLTAAMAGLSACGGGGGSSSGGGGGGGGGTGGTTAGQYTFTVTGAGSPALSSNPVATFTVTVN